VESRLRHRTVVLAAALSLTFSIPLVAAAATPDDPPVPKLDLRDASGAVTPSRFQPEGSPTSAVGAASTPLRTAQAPLAPAAAQPPAIIGGVTVSSVTSTTALVNWTPPADGGSAITSYHLQLLVGGSLFDEFTSSTPMTGATIFDLDPDTAFEFRVAAINAAGPGAFSSPVTFTTAHVWLERQYGADRFETAVRVSESAFPYEGVPVTFVSNGLNFPDALAAAAAAGAFGGPVLLTRPTAVSQPVVDEVAALKPDHVFATGGTAAVSDSVLNKLRPSAQVSADRLAGVSRFETAGEISTLWGTADTVYLANGMNFPDALAGAAAAGHNGAPVLLMKQNSLPPETAMYLKHHRPSKLIVLGGTGAVSAAAVAQAKSAAAGAQTSVARLWGASRYDTAVDISRRTFPSPRVPIVYVASGRNFADALAGAAAAGALGGPVLLTESNVITNATLSEIRRLDPIRIVVLGGPSVVSSRVFDQIAGAVD
jgi:putative cell wall-binding protein